MNYKIKLLILLALGTMLLSCQPKQKQDQATMQPPEAEKKAKELTAHGDTRVDNYYWMRLSDEQKRAKKPDKQTRKVRAYLEAENAYAEAMLAHTEDLQETIYDEIVGRIKKDDNSVPYLDNGYWYYTRYEEGKEYPIHCRKKGTLQADEEILLDVNTHAKGHEYYAASGLRVSPDNKILAFGEDTLSRRIYTIRFINLETGQFMQDEIPNTTGSGAWASDNATFFYTAKNKQTLLSEKIVRHSLGQSASKDQVAYHEKDPSFYIGVSRSKSGGYIIISERSTLVSDYHILPADNPGGEFQQFTPRSGPHEYSIDHANGKFYILTNWEAQNFRLMETPEKATEKGNWKEVIPHREDVYIGDFEVFQDYLVLEERENASLSLRVINQKENKDFHIAFDEPAYSVYISTNPELETQTLRFVYSSFTTPSSVYDYNMATRERELKKRTEVVGGHNPEDYITDRLWAPARDGKKIPISIVYKKGFRKNGKAPLLLYGYGSYGAIYDPGFRFSLLSLLDRGFAFALAHIRGSEMMGRKWYDDGKMLNKINTFNDYIDCARYLKNENYTSTDKLFGLGGSAGGLLIGAVANMAPQEFKGLVAAVPFVDVVTTMSDPTIPLTTNEYDEWGNPADEPCYHYMKSYSPYDNVKPQEYPNMLINTGFFDSQVQYWEPAKWAAKLRDNWQGDNLLLFHTNMGAGHGGASGRFRRYKETAMEYAFMIDLAGN